MSSPDEQKKYRYLTKIWKEEPEDDNPFAAKACYCYGYDVYGDILQKASWFEYLYLLFKGERPTKPQANLLEKLAIVLANPGPREASVRAAMNGGVSKATHAATLMAALAVGAGQYGGSHEVYLLMDYYRRHGLNLEDWLASLTKPIEADSHDIWSPIEHSPGFDPNGVSCSSPVTQSLNVLSTTYSGGALSWLHQNRAGLESGVGYPLAMSGVAAAAFYDLQMDQHQASMLFLMLRLPGSAVHALEQRSVGWKRFPFFADAISLENDPGFKGVPKIEGINA